MVPDMRPYIDTRLILHTSGEYTDYLEAVANPEKFDLLADAQHFQYVVLTTAYPDLYLGLVQHLAASADWCLIFTDGSEVLFARRGPAVNLGDRGTTIAILRGLKQRFSGSTALHEAARLNLARLLIVLGEVSEAQAVLATLDSRAAAQMRARAFVVAGESAAAESLALILVDSDPHDVRSLALLAQLAIAAGDARVGAQWLERALVADPYDPESRAVLEHLERAAPNGFATP
jgi:tetratricopeptide (TPR) repeat protein